MSLRLRGVQDWNSHSSYLTLPATWSSFLVTVMMRFSPGCIFKCILKFTLVTFDWNSHFTNLTGCYVIKLFGEGQDDETFSTVFFQMYFQIYIGYIWLKLSLFLSHWLLDIAFPWGARWGDFLHCVFSNVFSNLHRLHLNKTLTLPISLPTWSSQHDEEIIAIVVFRFHKNEM